MSYAKIVNDELRTIENHNGFLNLYMEAPNLPALRSAFMPFTTMEPAPNQAGVTMQPNFNIPAQPGLNVPFNHERYPTARHVRSLEHAQSKYEQELKELDRNESFCIATP